LKYSVFSNYFTADLIILLPLNKIVKLKYLLPVLEKYWIFWGYITFKCFRNEEKKKKSISSRKNYYIKNICNELQ
jgi:hypothetical protein